jgi:DNA polymerase III delta prime subunit
MSKANATTKSKTKAIIPRYRSKRPRLFGPPPLLAGEDAAAYEELHAGIHAAENPIDTVDAIYVAEAASSAWEAQRWNRLKTSLIRGYQIKALEKLLREKLKLQYDLYAQDFAAKIVPILRDTLPEDQAKQLADASARNEPDANERVDKILEDSGSSSEDILDSVRRHKAEELAKKYARNEPDAVTLVDKILADANVDIYDLVTEDLVKGFDAFEHIDRRAGSAQSRFSTSLRDIDQRRTARGENLRIVNGTFVETTPPKGKR